MNCGLNGMKGRYALNSQELFVVPFPCQICWGWIFKYRHIFIFIYLYKLYAYNLHTPGHGHWLCQFSSLVTIKLSLVSYYSQCGRHSVTSIHSFIKQTCIQVGDKFIRHLILLKYGVRRQECNISHLQRVKSLHTLPCAFLPCKSCSLSNHSWGQIPASSRSFCLSMVRHT